MKNIKETYPEKKFQEYFKKVGKINNCSLIKTEYVLVDPMSLFKRNLEITEDAKSARGSIIGKIDLLFKYQRLLYVGEIKWNVPRSDFWDALKILGYTTYYNWQNEINRGFDPVRPAILIPKKHIRLEHKIIANKLKIALFGIIKNKEDYNLELVNP